MDSQGSLYSVNAVPPVLPTRNLYQVVPGVPALSMTSYRSVPATSSVPEPTAL